MNEGPTIVRLGPDDASAMRRLNAMFGEAFEDRPSYEAAPPDDGYFARVLGRDDVIVLAATADGDTIGGIVAYRLDKLEQARSEIYLYDLAVAERYRRRGIATALIERLRAVARECGAWMVFVQADPPDAPAVALYEKLGRREAVFHYDIAP